LISLRTGRSAKVKEKKAGEKVKRPLLMKLNIIIPENATNHAKSCNALV
jgi:hypothetical protein